MSSNWKDRIVSFSRKPAHEFLANPSNARRHPARQREALRGSLDTIGWASPVIVSAKSGYMLDGHARVEEALSKDENALIPVIEVDLDEHEEKLFLASFDYITYMAEYDRDSLDALLRDVNTDNDRLQAMLSDLAMNEGITPPDFQPIDASELSRLDQLEPKTVVCPHCGETFDARGNEA